MKTPCSWRADQANYSTLAAFALTLALPAAPAANPQFVSGVNVVEVYASVTDARGEPIRGLGRDDFEVLENGEPQVITAFAEGSFPLSVAVAIDRSFSMAGRRLDQAKDAARVFLSELRPSDEAMIVTIGSDVQIAAPLSTDRTAEARALDAVDAFGTTGLHDAILKAIEAVQPARGRRALVLLSDGNDRYSTASADDALEGARRSDVMVYPVALGSTRPPLFAELATLTGGRSFHATDAKSLPDTLRRIARELRQQYLIGYSPSRPVVTGHGQWRAIHVRVRPSGAKVRARDGYLIK